MIDSVQNKVCSEMKITNLQHFMVTVSQAKLLQKRSHHLPVYVNSTGRGLSTGMLKPYNVTAVIFGTIQSVQTYHHIFTKHFTVAT